MGTNTLTLVVLLALATAACKASRSSAAIPGTAAAGAASRVDRQAQEQKIRGLEGRWREPYIWNRGEQP